jgi:hypothetical protein
LDRPASVRFLSDARTFVRSLCTRFRMALWPRVGSRKAANCLFNASAISFATLLGRHFGCFVSSGPASAAIARSISSEVLSLAIAAARIVLAFLRFAVVAASPIPICMEAMATCSTLWNASLRSIGSPTESMACITASTCFRRSLPSSKSTTLSKPLGMRRLLSILSASPHTTSIRKRKRSSRGSSRNECSPTPPPVPPPLCVSARGKPDGGGLSVRRRLADRPRAKGMGKRSRSVPLCFYPQRRDVTCRFLLRRICADNRPLSHEPAAFLEHVAAPIGLLDLVADDVPQRSLDNLILERIVHAEPAFRPNGKVPD